jgi:DNA-binding NarL/FixJ family response regulator
MTNDYLEILIVEKHTLTTFALQRMLKRVMPKCSVRIAVSLQEAEEVIRKQSFDLYVIYMHPIDESVFKLIKNIRELYSESFILLGVAAHSVTLKKQLCNNQVNALLSREDTCHEFEIAIHHLIRQESYCSEVFGAYKTKLRSKKKAKMHKDDFPTKREMEVLEFIAQGEKTLQIATVLGISVNTVETHRRNLFQKLGAKNGVDLIVKSISEGWIEAK